MEIFASTTNSSGGGGQEGHPASWGSSFELARGRVENKLKDLGCYLPLYKAAITGEWHEARKFLEEDPEAVTAKITVASETALHISVGTRDGIDFVERLLSRMSPEDLAIVDQNGETALTVAAVVGNIKAAKLLVNKNPDLPNMSGKLGLPLHRAAHYGQKEMVKYLLHVTRGDIEPSPFAGKSGGELLVALITAEFYDTAHLLVKHYPDIATVELHGIGIPLSVLASKTSAFPSGSNGTSWYRLLYSPVSFIMDRIRKPHMQREALELLKILVKETCVLDDATAFSLLQKPLHCAAIFGIPEIIKEIVNAVPSIIWSSDDEHKNVFQLAVLHRRENVFSLIYQLSNYRHFDLITRYKDSCGNNSLHLAGKLPSPERLNLVSGAALQVQRELQWFKEVQKFIPPAQKEATNNEGKTPEVVFTKEHEQLLKDGETWLKTTASSCTVVATLIAAVAFAAAMHVPGGYDSKHGEPLFAHRRAFGVFAVVDALSLFSSITSVLMFLSILTSRYSQDNFLYILPTGLIFGLSMLFISILSMMGAFGAATVLVFGPKKAKLFISLGTCAVMLPSLFVLLPLLIQIVKSTCCGIFPRKAY